MSRAVRYLLKRLYVLCAIALISLAVLVQLGRSLAPLAENYAQPLADSLSEQVGLTFAFGAISADWRGLKPALNLYQVQVQGEGGEPILHLEQARLQLDLWASLLQRRWHWSTIALQGGAMTFAQLPDGRWQLPGLPRAPAIGASSAATQTREDFFGLFLLGTRVHFEDTHFTFEFADQHRIALHSPRVLLENSRRFHRLIVELNIDERENSVHLVLEGRGDPRAPEQFVTRGYLQLQAIPTQEPLQALVAALFASTEVASTDLVDPDGESVLGWDSDGQLDAHIWIDSLPDGAGFSFVGDVHIDSLTLPLAQQPLRLHSLDTLITGQWRRDRNWRLALQDFSALWNDSRLEDLNLGLTSGADHRDLQVQLERIELLEVHRLLADNGWLGEGRLREVIDTLAPRGYLQRVHIDIPHRRPEAWQVRAELHEGAVNPWQGVPGLTGVSGLVRADRSGGSIDLDSRSGFSMFYPDVYTRPMHYQQARGQVAWWLQPDNNRVYVNSGPLTLANHSAGNQEQALGYLWLSLPWQRNTGDVDLYLHIGARNVGANLHRKYVPALVPDNLLSWLERSIGRNNPGHALNGGFVFRGSLNRPGASTHQLRLNLADARLDYHPEWPALHDLSGTLVLDDNRLQAHIERARVYDSEVRDVEVRLQPNPEGSQPLLHLQGGVQGIASDGLRVLRESYLRRYIGDNMDTWYILGQIRGQLALAIPLDPLEPGARQQLQLEVEASTMALDNFGVELRQVQGEIHYDDRTGLSSRGLGARLFNEPLTVAISSPQTPDGPAQTRIQLDSRLSMDNLQTWLERPELHFFQGATGVRARIELIHQPVSDQVGPPADDLLAAVLLESDLNGIAVDLPAELGKPANESRPLAINLMLGRHTAVWEMRYGEQLHALAQLLRADNRILNANLALAAQAQLQDRPQLLLSGVLNDPDPAPWRELFERYQGYAGSAGSEPLPAWDTLPPLRAELLVRRYPLGPLTLTDLHVTAERHPGHWQVQFHNDTLGGNLLLPPAPQPAQLTLDYLDYQRPVARSTASAAPPTLDAGELVDAPGLAAVQQALAQEVPSEPPSAPLDPRQLPAAEVSIADLRVDGEHYGELHFSLRPSAEGAEFTDVHALIRGLTIGGDSPESGAQLLWLIDAQGSQRTELHARVQAGNLAEVMQAWQLEPMIESQQAETRMQLHWPGAPQAFSLAGLGGSLDIDVRNGRFTRAPAGGGDGLLRLFAILNFDSLARRLRLDFTDLYQSGLAYDDIRGRVSFDQGTLLFTEPLQVRSPSSRMQLAGSVNLLDETLDARLIATLPVAGNLTFLTALAAGLPAAAGVYLVSKLFEKQVDQATSISYGIRGTWDDPQVRFDRMFEGDSSRNGSREVQPEAEPR